MVHEIKLPAHLSGTELLRVIRKPDGNIVMSINFPAVEDPDPGYWGLLMADLGQHVANALTGRLVADDGAPFTREAILARLRQVFDGEWGSPKAGAQRLTPPDA